MPPPPASYAPGELHAGHRAVLGDDQYRSPGLAVALSLQPLPIDFGNLYAENLGWGIAYTTVEVSLMAPMMWLSGEHMDHGYGNDRSWSGNERGAMIGLVAAYVGVKLAAGWQAGSAARALNRAYEPRATAFVAPERRGAMLAWLGEF